MKLADWQEIKVVFLKDLIEVWRDHRTLFAMMIMPALIYPAMLAVPSHVTQHLKHTMKAKHADVAILGGGAGAVQFFKESDTLRVRDIKDGADPEKILEAKQADVVVVFPKDFDQIIAGKLDRAPQVSILYDARRDKSIMAVLEARMVLGKFKRQCQAKRFAELGVRPPNHYEINFTDIGRRTSLSSETVRGMLPFILFTMLCVAVIYPALDVITGERERNTLVLLLLSACKRRNIMLGKLGVVCVIGLSAMIIGLLSLYISINFATAKGGGETFIFPISAALTCAAICTPLVFSLAATAILLASCCKTFQQGQGYSVPFLLLFISSSAVCSLPDLKLSSGIAFVPVLNLAVALKEGLSGQAEPLWLCLSVAISIALAVVLCHYASGILNSDRLLFDISDSTARRRAEGNFTSELAILASVVFLLMFYVGQSLQLHDPIIGTLLTQVLVILAPALILLRYLKLPARQVLSLKMPRLAQIAGALLISPLCLLISMSVYSLQCSIVPAPEAFNTMFTKLFIGGDKPPWLLITALCLAPGICEEILFRGAILGLLRRRLKPLQCCLVVGFLFGLFHMSVFRILPTGTLGVILTGLCILTGSIVPSMLVHALHNTAAVLLAKHGQESLIFQYWPIELIAGVLGSLILAHDFVKNRARTKSI